MLVDWFTVIAQIVNFLILVALLKHFLYDRIIRAMDKREERIRSSLEAAERKRRDAENEAENYRRKNDELKEKQDRLLAEARDEAERKRKELTQKAREAVEKARAKWEESLEREKGTFLQDLKQLAAKEVYAVSQKALKDLADVDLEERLVNVFVSRLRQMKQEHKDVMGASIRNGDNQAVVRSGFELSTGSRQKITKAARGEIAEGVNIDYDTDPEMIVGIELRAAGEKVVWSVRNYIEELEKKVRRVIEGTSRVGEEKKNAADERSE